METKKLKSDVQKMLDNTTSKSTLQAIHDYLKAKESSSSGKIWDSLTEEQREETLISYEESFDEKNLIPAEKVFKSLK